jgi:hypothetical protein
LASGVEAGSSSESDLSLATALIALDFFLSGSVIMTRSSESSPSSSSEKFDRRFVVVATDFDVD